MIKEMLRAKANYVVIMVMAMTMLSLTTMAQDSEITDDDLRKYALLEEVITLMKKDISSEVNKLIKNQEGMTGARYLELAKTKGDEAKLAELEAKDYEITFLGLVDDLKAKRAAAIKVVNQELATKMVGDNGKTYKAIKSALGADDAMKDRYAQIKAGVQGTDD